MANDEFLKVRLAAWREFETGFRLSRKGNLWREYDGLRVTVFSHSNGTFGWSINDGDEVNYSARSYDEQESAMLGLFEALGWLS